jgi:hypothetical protein
MTDMFRKLLQKVIEKKLDSLPQDRRKENRGTTWIVIASQNFAAYNLTSPLRAE